MGNLIWHEWARYVSITASLYSIWAAFYGILYRKFFWDFIGGTLRAPGGLQPSPGIALFIDIIVKAPVVQLITMFMAMGMVALEFPAPFVKGTSIQRNFTIKLVMLIMQAFSAIMFYQGTNGAIYSLVAAIGYGRAMMLGEVMEEAKNNKGRGGKA
ncbi:uncharacterized protein C8Q71DRAFT_704311 [Rhodofomes roseus]|uniref:DUF7727 domain-containing protein n=1 Tax=Rhodofomes roseus TaxID=34475 RepID=A0A4Y9YDZ6_9APHY|nr:uncharacterized protein C8Q71DRAFT_704311 [Rhodofomes roseus]KAH9839338.1 hypothetical protein C8Q71DRAFT_704311 [Rhodofomes roseus]TFY60555.1 hypothetical protein EVJ58_g5080 [Rhodofomes roseus]